MAETRRSPATWVDLERFPEGVNAEVIAGEVVVSPRSRPAHGLAQTALASAVGGSFGLRRPPGGWWIVIEVEVELAASRRLHPRPRGLAARPRPSAS